MFIRHGESEWNDIFNKGFKPSFLGRLFGEPQSRMRSAATELCRETNRLHIAPAPAPPAPTEAENSRALSSRSRL